MLLFCNAQNKIEHLDLLTYIFLKDLISINGTLDGFGYNLFDAWMRSVIYVVHHFKFIPNDDMPKNLVIPNIMIFKCHSLELSSSSVIALMVITAKF